MKRRNNTETYQFISSWHYTARQVFWRVTHQRSKGCFPVMHSFYVRIRTECSEHVNSFIDAYWAYSTYVNVRKKNASLENSLNSHAFTRGSRKVEIQGLGPSSVKGTFKHWPPDPCRECWQKSGEFSHSRSDLFGGNYDYRGSPRIKYGEKLSDRRSKKWYCGFKTNSVRDVYHRMKTRLVGDVAIVRHARSIHTGRETVTRRDFPVSKSD